MVLKYCEYWQYLNILQHFTRDKQKTKTNVVIVSYVTRRPVGRELQTTALESAESLPPRTTILRSVLASLSFSLLYQFILCVSCFVFYILFVFYLYSLL